MEEEDLKEEVEETTPLSLAETVGELKEKVKNLEGKLAAEKERRPNEPLTYDHSPKMTGPRQHGVNTLVRDAKSQATSSGLVTEIRSIVP